MNPYETLAPAGEIKALTSLRGIAAFAVVLQHFSTTAQYYSSAHLPSLAPHGYMAVDFFFVLSGFIMSYTYLAAFEKEGWRAYGPFFLKRVARIAPLGLTMIAVILILGGIASFWGQQRLFIDGSTVKFGLSTAVLINILHLQGFFHTANLNDPSWSISIEMAAYALFPILIRLVFGGSKWFSYMALIAGTALLCFCILTGWRPDGYPRVLTVVMRCLVEFGYGMFVYRLARAPRFLPAIAADRWTWTISILTVIALLLGLDLVAALAFPFVVLTWVRNAGSASRIMSSGILYFLGEISFSIYLVHNVFRKPELALVKHVFPQPLPYFGALIFALVGSLLVIPVAALAYRYVERPGRDAVKALIRRPKMKPALL